MKKDLAVGELASEELIKLYEKLKKYKGSDEVVSHEQMRQLLKGKDAKIRNYLTLLPRLDKMIQGIQTSELIALGGPTKHGKTTLAQTFTYNLQGQGHKCLWFTFEVPVGQFLESFKPEHIFYLPKSLTQGSLSWLRDRILEGKIKFDTRIVFIDNLHHIIDLEKIKNTSLEIGSVVRYLKRMAIELNVAIVMICHSRKPEDKDGKQREISEWDLRDSSFIPQESDATIMIQRNKVEAEEAYDENLISEQGIVKVCLHRRTGVIGRKVRIIRKNGWIQEDEEEYAKITATT